MSYTTCITYCVFWMLVLAYLVGYKGWVRRREARVVLDEGC